ncbi:MAG: DEAD/DEAH box helicase [Candidatus Komeilibacteria bacterium]
MNNSKQEHTSFANLGITPSLLNQLQKLKFNKPTPIQHQAIPIAIKGQDLMGIAQTGTGKTMAFGIPMIQRLSSHKGMGLILLPTRELTAQVDQALKTLGQSFGLRTAILIGGTPQGPQIKALARNPHIIIATPGRLIDLLEQKRVKLNTVKILVLDEADRMLDMGFEPQIKKILETVPTDQRQTMLFSATMPEKITKLAQNYLRSPLRIEVAPAGTAAANIEQEMFMLPRNEKLSLLNQLLNEYKQRILIFSRTKHGAKKITKAIQKMGHRAAEIHSNKSLAQRTKAMKDFKSGAIRILVATDIASRGIDVQDIEVVINYDLPDNPEDYVHRIGRTGRAEKSGKAISFAAPEQKRDIAEIERLVRIQLPIKPLPIIKEHITMPKEQVSRGQNSQRSHGPRNYHVNNNRNRRPSRNRQRNNKPQN